jgi:hypothetical protein
MDVKPRRVAGQSSSARAGVRTRPGDGDRRRAGVVAHHRLGDLRAHRCQGGPGRPAEEVVQPQPVEQDIHRAATGAHRLGDVDVRPWHLDAAGPAQAQRAGGPAGEDDDRRTEASQRVASSSADSSGEGPAASSSLTLTRSLPATRFLTQPRTSAALPMSSGQALAS